MSLDDVKFRRPVVPGDQLRLEVEVVQMPGRTCGSAAGARSTAPSVAEAEMMARIVDR